MSDVKFAISRDALVTLLITAETSLNGGTSCYCDSIRHWLAECHVCSLEKAIEEVKSAGLNWSSKRSKIVKEKAV